eukprot:IDg847t1
MEEDVDAVAFRRGACIAQRPQMTWYTSTSVRTPNTDRRSAGPCPSA